MNKRINRRDFIRRSGCGALSTIPLKSSILNLKMANQAAAANHHGYAWDPDDYKTLVCLFLFGGNDAFNTLVPTDDRYDEYTTTRSNLVLDQESLHAIDQTGGGDGGLYGLHPALPGIQELFNGLSGDTNRRRVSIISNVGPMIVPTSKGQFLNESVELPKALYSHLDQQYHWQTSIPQGMDKLSGWAGRASDVIHSSLNTDFTSMSISLYGNNLMQIGNDIQPFVINRDGALLLEADDIFGAGSLPMMIRNNRLKGALETTQHNLLQQAFDQTTLAAIDSQERYQSIFQEIDVHSLSTSFQGNSALLSDMSAALKSIMMRPQLGLHRQTIFVVLDGFDTHSDLQTRHHDLLTEVDQALLAFQSALEELNLQDTVLTFTASDFGRTLRSNGQGTDHAWGGHSLLMGGPVDGGKLFGTYPSLAVDGPDDVGNGIILPTISTDEFFTEMLQWFGVSNTDLPYVLPNIENFYSIGSGSPIGFLKT
jgi:uncharacterized protein (DUF1501 family)